jgi:hypothetical protein
MNGMKKIANKAVKSHEARMHSTKKMAKGGVTSEQMKLMGSGLARVKNQGSK